MGRTKTNKNAGGLLPKIEILIIIVFFISFIIWAMSKCSITQSEYEQKAAKKLEQAPVETLRDTEEEKNQTLKKLVPEKRTVLYVILEDLNLRKGPHLDSAIIKRFKLNEELYFLNEVTNFKQKINLGEEQIAEEPWIKVRASTGHEGWVYGAGVNYYKPIKTN